MVNRDLCPIADAAIRAGVRFHVEGGRLIATGNVGRLDEGTRAEIGHQKGAIVAALEGLPAGCRVPRLCMALAPCMDAGLRCGSEAAQQEGRDVA